MEGVYAHLPLAQAVLSVLGMLRHLRGACYHCGVFSFGKSKTAGDWIVHIAGALVTILLVWWMLRMYVL
jgi:hypothetical protein